MSSAEKPMPAAGKVVVGSLAFVIVLAVGAYAVWVWGWHQWAESFDEVREVGPEYHALPADAAERAMTALSEVVWSDDDPEVAEARAITHLGYELGTEVDIRAEQRGEELAVSVAPGGNPGECIVVVRGPDGEWFQAPEIAPEIARPELQPDGEGCTPGLYFDGENQPLG